jgi:diguanylate cyclase (GGDEF)-like protein
MKLTRDRLSGSSLALGLLLLTGVGIVSYRSAHRLTQASDRVSHSAELAGDIRQVNSDLTEAEEAQERFALFRDPSELSRSLASMNRISPALEEIRRLSRDNPSQQVRLNGLNGLLPRRIALLQSAISPASYSEAELVSQGSHQLLAEMETEERLLLVDREQRASSETRITALVVLGGFLLASIFVAGAGGLGRWETTRSRETEDALSAAQETIASGRKAAEARVRESTTLSELAADLQSCRSLAEGLPFMSLCMEQLLPEESGCIFLSRPTRDTVDSAATWGTVISAASFSSVDCRALRAGGLQVVAAQSGMERCAHLNAEAGLDALCLPLVAQGETLGVLCQCSTGAGSQVMPDEGFLQNRLRIASLAATQISLAVGNLQLRETLRNHSIRDLLTGLFNRHYMEESLSREFSRARRRKSPLAVIMLDIDHFKRFNEKYGHDLGDRLLRDFGRFLTANIRGEDIACRYGGEAFTLILADAAAEGALKRADTIRRDAAQICIPLEDGSTTTVTISIGVAIYPEHGTTPETLLQAAGTALFRAKAEGRDRLVKASYSALAG